MINWVLLTKLVMTAGVANMIPPLSARVWPKWNKPIDGPHLGSHKTWRGLITGVIGAQIIFILLGGIEQTPWFFGALLGIGGLGGDMVKSFFKRKMGRKPGTSWFPWDQIDWIAGLIVVAKLWQLLNLSEILTLFVVGLGLHLMVRMIGYFLKINDEII
jgi:CDP-2,3-bis-(O-geranylgeranyl)-sn-glycerol synthase